MGSLTLFNHHKLSLTYYSGLGYCPRVERSWLLLPCSRDVDQHILHRHSLLDSYLLHQIGDVSKPKDARMRQSLLQILNTFSEVKFHGVRVAMIGTQNAARQPSKMRNSSSQMNATAL
jgi:hypothetical protein